MARKCFICKKKDDPINMFIDGILKKVTCRVPECMAAYSLWKLDKQKKANEKAVTKKNRKELLDFNRKDLKWQHDNTQREFNKMRVMQEKLWYLFRGLEPECISCGGTNMDWCCGHYKSRGASSNLRYDERNTYLQCNRYCNSGLSANITGNATSKGYMQGLLDRFGDNGQPIIDYCEMSQAKVKRWTCEEVEAIRVEALAKQKILKVELETYAHS